MLAFCCVVTDTKISSSIFMCTRLASFNVKCMQKWNIPGRFCRMKWCAISRFFLLYSCSNASLNYVLVDATKQKATLSFIHRIGHLSLGLAAWQGTSREEVMATWRVVRSYSGRAYSQLFVWEDFDFHPIIKYKVYGYKYLYPSYGPSVSLLMEMHVGMYGRIITSALIVTGLYPWEEYTQEGALPFTQH